VSANPQIKLDWERCLSNTDNHSYGLLCAWLGQLDHRKILTSCAFPTRFIAGEDDLAAPSDLVRELAHLMGSQDIIELPTVGHVPSVEAPERIVEILQL
jgi:3-oxoadipate enol-lactonase